MFCQSILKLHQSEVSINSKLCDSIQKHSISHSWQRNTYTENAWDFGLCGGCFSNNNFVRYFSSCSSLISKTASANKVIRCFMKHWEISILMSDFHCWSLKNELQLKICMCNWKQSITTGPLNPSTMSNCEEQTKIEISERT